MKKNPIGLVIRMLRLLLPAEPFEFRILFGIWHAPKYEEIELTD